MGNGSNTKIDDTRPTFSGRAGSEQIVTLYSGVTVLGSVQADKFGYWTIGINTDLTTGRHEFIARTETLASNKFTLNVEAAADVPVTITSAFDGVGHQQSVGSGSNTKIDDTRPVFSGRAGSEQIVTLYSGVTVLGSVQADKFGYWTIGINTDLTNGRHEFIARTETRTSDKFILNVEAASDVPVTITDAMDNVGQPQYLSRGDKTDDTRPTFHGRSGTEQIVTLYSGNTVLGSVQADKRGFWSLEIITDLTDGRHEIIARTETRASDKYIINYQPAADEPVTIASVYDDYQWQYIQAGSGMKIYDTRPTFHGTAGSEEIVTLYSGTILLGSVQADLKGNWSLEITIDLVSGINRVSAQTTTQQSTPLDVILADVVDFPVIIDWAYDNVGRSEYLTGHYSPKIDDTRPTFYGQSAPDQIVTLYEGKTVLGSVQAGSGGEWSLEITTDLKNGVNEVIARTETQESHPFTVNIETKPEFSFILYGHSEILIDNSDALFNDIAQSSSEETLVLTLSEADMLFESAGMVNQDSHNGSAHLLTQEDENYLIAVV